MERLNRNLDERRFTSTVFLNVAKAFDTVWVDGLLYKLCPQLPVLPGDNHFLV
jgi:hypothetical protein